MITAMLGTVFLVYWAAVILLIATRDGVREPAPAPAPRPPGIPSDDFVRTIVLPRALVRSAREQLVTEWAAKAWDYVDAELWPHLVPAWRTEEGSFRAAIIEEATAVAA